MGKPIKSLLNAVLWLGGLTEEPSVEYKQIDEDVKVTKREKKSYYSSGGTLGRILQRGHTVHFFSITLEGSSGEIISDKEKMFEDFQIGDKARVSYNQAYLITSNFVYPNFSEKKEIKRERAYYADKIKRLDKLTA